MICILRYKGKGKPDLQELSKLLADQQATIEDVLPDHRMVQVETGKVITLPSCIRKNWDVLPFMNYHVPTTRRTVSN